MKNYTMMMMAAVITLMAGCSTEYYAYQGGSPTVGQGGACKRVNGVDIWLTGTPPRKFQIIGYIEDSRPGGPPSMAQRNSKVAASAKQQGGDGVLMQSDSSQYMGTFTSGNAFTSFNGFTNTALTTGSSFSAPMMRREGRFFVIKYL